MAVGRFQVMATLQAARALELGLPMDSALSWGLDRAIFYAAAKRGFKGKPGAGRHAGHSTGHTAEARLKEYQLGSEKAYSRSEKGKVYFVIGGKAQTKEDFERQVAARFGGRFEVALEDALDYVRHFDRETLLSGEGFFGEVYRPKRDEFAAKWTEMSSGSDEAPKKPRRK
jgi:hypothetical protein